MKLFQISPVGYFALLIARKYARLAAMTPLREEQSGSGGEEQFGSGEEEESPGRFDRW